MAGDEESSSGSERPELADNLRSLFAGNKSTVTVEDLAEVYRNFILFTDTMVTMFSATIPMEKNEKMEAIESVRKSVNRNVDELGESVRLLVKNYYGDQNGQKQ
jgi:hypothetical protein